MRAVDIIIKVRDHEELDNRRDPVLRSRDC